MYKIISLSISVIISCSSYGQKCNCNKGNTIGVNETIIDNTNNTRFALNPKGNTVLCLAPGQRKFLKLINFKGKSDRKFVIRNDCSGIVLFKESYPFSQKGYGILTEGCENIIISGAGHHALDPEDKYGIKIEGTVNPDYPTKSPQEKIPEMGIKLDKKSTRLEVEYIEVFNVNFAGIMAKTDPTCDGTSNRIPEDPHAEVVKFSSINWYMSNVKIHHNYIHDVGGEGMYIGNSFYTGYDYFSRKNLHNRNPEETRFRIEMAIPGYEYKLTSGESFISYTAKDGDTKEEIHSQLKSKIDKKVAEGNTNWTMAVWSMETYYGKPDFFIKAEMKGPNTPNPVLTSVPTCFAANGGSKVYPHPIYDLEVYDNIVKNTKWDGIQIGCADDSYINYPPEEMRIGTKVYNNLIVNTGLDKNSVHGNGMQIGGGTTGSFYNNTIADTYANGIIVLGKGNITIHDNKIISAGSLCTDNCQTINGIFFDTRTNSTDPGDEIKITSNTIINSKNNGIRMLNTNGISTINKVYNNFIAGGGLTGSGINNLGIEGNNIDRKNNYGSLKTDSLIFVDPASHNYRIKSRPVINGTTEEK